jgi:RNA-dependent RNA polymerase
MVCLDIGNILASRPKVGVAFRQSMEKFESENCSIDIVQTSHFSLSYLNRQIILLLSARRIPASVFHTLQNEMIDEVMSITRNPEYACQILSKFSGRSGGNGTHRLMIGFFTRFGLHTERFIRQILQSFQEFQMKRLRTKAQILVENGCMLFGVADETRTLKYEQVFIQIERDENEKSRIIQGPVIVTRNPCLHPGKIWQRSRERYPKELRRNVLLFGEMKSLRSERNRTVFIFPILKRRCPSLRSCG